jgi:hypothetical protein
MPFLLLLLLNLECGELSPLCYIAERCCFFFCFFFLFFFRFFFCRTVAVVVLVTPLKHHKSGCFWSTTTRQLRKVCRVRRRSATCQSGESSPHSKFRQPLAHHRPDKYAPV